MRNRWIAIGLCLVAIFFVLWSFRKWGGESSTSNLAKKEGDAGQAVPDNKADAGGLEPAVAGIEAANVPVEFQGKVVDENDLPVVGAAVKYRIKSVHQGSGPRDGRTAAVEKVVLSGGDGGFSIKGERGVLLTVLDISKEGYAFPADGRKDFGYAGFPEIHDSKRAAPVSFALVSRSSADAVEAKSMEITMPWNGRPTRFSMETGERDPSGGLILECRRTGRTGVFDWSVRVSVEGGGVLEVGEDSNLLAPEEGYLEALEVGYEKDAKPWRFGRDVSVFYRRGGEYGRLRLQLCADAGEGEVGAYVDRYRNKKGGRNTGVSNSIKVQ
jgi:hypothetical protein